MNQGKLLTLILSILMTSVGLLAPEHARLKHRGQLLQSAAYPKPGDIPTLNRKIFKGQRVTIREHPYVASIRRLCTHYLTGVLTTRSIVLTVAHPLVNVPVKDLNVVVGENYNDRGSILYTVVLVIIHQDFNPFTLRNDLAMLRIYEHIIYRMNVKALVMATTSDVLKGKKAFISGWGRCDNMGMELCMDRTTEYYPDEKMDPMLRTVSFIIKYPNYYCEGYKRHDVTLYPGMLCVGVAREEDQVAPCLAVPGAPLVVNARLVGLLSWGFGCGYSYDMPLVYTAIPYFLPWISRNNQLMYSIKQRNLTSLFKATKAAVLSQWLIESRNNTPQLNIRTDRNMETLPIDYHLTKLQGTIYDIRNSILDGHFNEEKMTMYEIIRKEAAAHSTTVTKKKTTTTPGRPFLSDESRREAGL